MSDYHNEIDAYCAQWLRNLMKKNLIPDGYVDERDIRDVEPVDLYGFHRCHFFSGIGIWAAGFRLAGIPDDVPAWSGSCPCQGFSVAGKRKGFADERHLWPAWFHLIGQCRPARILGEQVESPSALAWLDLVQADLEGLGYACGAEVSPAAGYGAPHGRHRIGFVAHALRTGRAEWRTGAGSGSLAGCGGACALANDDDERLEGRRRVSECPGERVVGADSVAGELGDTLIAARERDPGGVFRTQEEISSENRPQHGDLRLGYGDASSGNFSPVVDAESEQAWISRFARERRATGGFWEDADWIECRGGKWRPIEPGTFPLAHGHPRRMEQLRAYGNAVVLGKTAEFIKAAFEVMP